MRQSNQKTPYRRKPSRSKINSRMILAVLGVGTLILTALLAIKKDIQPQNQPVAGQPALQVDRQLVDLGDVKLGQPVEVSFELKNTGDQLIEFTDKPYIEVKEGC